MKVSKCSVGAIAAPSPKTYSYEELQKSAPEGVYVEQAKPNGFKWIVFCGFVARSLLIYHPGSGELNSSGGAVGPFVKIEATVCFEIREPLA